MIESLPVAMAMIRSISSTGFDQLDRLRWVKANVLLGREYLQQQLLRPLGVTDLRGKPQRVRHQTLRLLRELLHSRQSVAILWPIDALLYIPSSVMTVTDLRL
jgi:hypothetical protein